MRIIYLSCLLLEILNATILSAEQNVILKVQSGKNALQLDDGGDGLINANFPEPTDVRDVARAFSLWLDKRFEVDESVKAKVKLISPERVSKEEAERRFQKMLKLYGLKTVQEGGKIHIVVIKRG